MIMLLLGQSGRERFPASSEERRGIRLIIAGGNIVKSIASSVQLDAQAEKVNRPGQSTIL
jgi:hypothetical protein